MKVTTHVQGVQKVRRRYSIAYNFKRFKQLRITRKKKKKSENQTTERNRVFWSQTPSLSQRNNTLHVFQKLQMQNIQFIDWYLLRHLESHNRTESKVKGYKVATMFYRFKNEDVDKIWHPVLSDTKLNVYASKIKRNHKE